MLPLSCRHFTRYGTDTISVTSASSTIFRRVRCGIAMGAEMAFVEDGVIEFIVSVSLRCNILDEIMAHSYGDNAPAQGDEHQPRPQCSANCYPSNDYV
jgi:hypothetical protein